MRIVGTSNGKVIREARPYSKITEGPKTTYYDRKGNMFWSRHSTTHGYKGHSNPHWHIELPHSKPLNNRLALTIEYLKRIFGV